MKKYIPQTKIVIKGTYSVSEAAKYFGVHRCTVYTYINDVDHPLAHHKVGRKVKLRFFGSDLVAYKAAGLPKRGPKITIKIKQF